MYKLPGISFISRALVFYCCYSITHYNAMSLFIVSCPNPHCGLTFSSSCGLSLHLSSSRGQSCNVVAAQLNGLPFASTRSAPALSVCQIE